MSIFSCHLCGLSLMFRGVIVRIDVDFRMVGYVVCACGALHTGCLLMSLNLAGPNKTSMFEDSKPFFWSTLP